MGKLALAVVLLLLYSAYNAQNCKVAVLKMPLRHNSTFERVAYVTLTNPEPPRIMYDIRACLAHCDSIDCPAFSFHYLSKLCSRATGFENMGPERLSLEDMLGVEDKYLGLFVKMQNMPVLEECHPSKDSFEEFLKSYRNTTSPARLTSPATSEAPGTSTTSRISDWSSSTTEASATTRDTTSAISSSPSSSTIFSTQSSTAIHSTTSTTSSSSTTSQSKPTPTQTEAPYSTVKSTTEEKKSTDPATMPATSSTESTTPKMTTSTASYDSGTSGDSDTTKPPVAGSTTTAETTGESLKPGTTPTDWVEVTDPESSGFTSPADAWSNSASTTTESMLTAEPQPTTMTPIISTPDMKIAGTLRIMRADGTELAFNVFFSSSYNFYKSELKSFENVKAEGELWVVVKAGCRVDMGMNPTGYKEFINMDGKEQLQFKVTFLGRTKGFVKVWGTCM